MAPKVALPAHAALGRRGCALPCSIRAAGGFGILSPLLDKKTEMCPAAHGKLQDLAPLTTAILIWSNRPIWKFEPRLPKSMAPVLAQALSRTLSI